MPITLKPYKNLDRYSQLADRSPVKRSSGELIGYYDKPTESIIIIEQSAINEITNGVCPKLSYSMSIRGDTDAKNI